ncbi:GNAT family N-acetyltransferase [Vibrio cortegadensis]|uniref:GNAT family N-acetyltransferase n=1 Tax=Vibrio cortegadensis TaxID=1328770 RepID=UPI00352F0F05
MSEVKIEQLDPIKIPLIKKLYKDHYPSAKAKKSELIITISESNQLSGVVRFREIEHFRLLTGMLTIPKKRGMGLANKLMAHCKSNILTRSDYCFAYNHLELFYQKHCFIRVEVDDMPNSVKCLFLRYVNSGKDLIPMQFVG